MAQPQIVGHPCVVTPNLIRLEAGTEVKYGGLGSVTIAKNNSDGTYDLQIPGVGTKRVQQTEFEYYLVFMELVVANVRYTMLTAHNTAEQEFKSIIKEAIVAEAGVIMASDISIELHRTSVAANLGERTCWWQRKQWQSSTLVRVVITPGHVSAGTLHISLSASPTLSQKITDSFASVPFWKPLVDTEMIYTKIKAVSVITDMQPMAPLELYPIQPELCCWYYNEDDPRSIVIGRDDLQCGQPALSPNLATRMGTCFCILMLPFFIIFFPFLPCRAIM